MNPETLSVVHPDVWQPLPARGRGLFQLGHGIGFALLGLWPGIAAGVLAMAAFDQPRTVMWLLIGIGVIAGALFGIRLGGRRHGYYRWKLDEDGFAVRRGRLWQTETHVPATRVQHLDVKRGPLERRRDLATLIIHTAGTRLESIRVPCLDAGDAEALRAALAARTEPERDDD